MNIIPFRQKTYSAKAFRIPTIGRIFIVSGTLDGYMDFAIVEDDGVTHTTYILDCNEARQLASALLGAADDIQKNCLFEQDPLLVD